MFLYLDRMEPAGGEESRGEEAGAVIPVAGDIIAWSKRRDGSTPTCETWAPTCEIKGAAAASWISIYSSVGRELLHRPHLRLLLFLLLFLLVEWVQQLSLDLVLLTPFASPFFLRLMIFTCVSLSVSLSLFPPVETLTVVSTYSPCLPVFTGGVIVMHLCHQVSVCLMFLHGQDEFFPLCCSLLCLSPTFYSWRQNNPVLFPGFLYQVYRQLFFPKRETLNHLTMLQNRPGASVY